MQAEPDALLHLGLATADLVRTEEAIELLQRCLGLAPSERYETEIRTIGHAWGQLTGRGGTGADIRFWRPPTPRMNNDQGGQR